jgi:TolA-binding protein
MKIPGTILIASFMVLLLSGSAASAADKDILQLQLDVSRLQKTLNELQTAVDSKNAAVTAQVGKMADQMNNLTVTMQKVSDSVSAMKVESTATNAALITSAAKSATETRDVLMPLLAELRKSMEDIKDGQRVEAKAISDQLISMKSGSEPLPTCKDLKQLADRSFNSNYLDDAVGGYRDFLANPTCASDPKAGEVHFMIAESLFNLKKYDQAVIEYDILLKNYPSHDKTASALYRKGLAHAELKQIPEARAALTRVTKEFASTPEAVLATNKLKELAPAAASRGTRGTQ